MLGKVLAESIESTIARRGAGQITTTTALKQIGKRLPMAAAESAAIAGIMEGMGEIASVVTPESWVGGPGGGGRVRAEALRLALSKSGMHLGQDEAGELSVSLMQRSVTSAIIFQRPPKGSLPMWRASGRAVRSCVCSASRPCRPVSSTGM